MWWRCGGVSTLGDRVGGGRWLDTRTHTHTQAEICVHVIFNMCGAQPRYDFALGGYYTGLADTHVGRTATQGFCSYTRCGDTRTATGEFGCGERAPATGTGACRSVNPRREVIRDCDVLALATTQDTSDFLCRGNVGARHFLGVSIVLE